MKTTKLAIATAMTLALLASPSVVGSSAAWAQATPTPPGATSSAAAAAAAAKPNIESDLYWAKQRHLHSIQQRTFLKVSRHEFTLFLGIIPNDEFFTYMPLGVRWNYFWNEDISSEVWGEYDITAHTRLKHTLESKFNGTLTVETPQTLQWMGGADVIWSLVHGKFSVFTNFLDAFDIHLAFGAGAIGTTVHSLGRTKAKVDISANVGLGVSVYLTDMISLRADYRQYFYHADGGGLSHPAEITIGVSLWTPAPK